MMLFASIGTTHAAYVYVGSWDFATLGGGNYDSTNPYWWESNPTVYSGVEAAAFLFGGSPSDYAISTIDDNPANINNLAYLDGWADTQYLVTPQSETFKLDTGAPGYNEPFGGPAYSALVFDHGPDFPNARNYAFRVSNGVPEHTGFLTLGLAGLSLGAASRFRRRS
jgi:hypothetical protein